MTKKKAQDVFYDPAVATKEIIRNSLNTKVESTDLSSFVDFIDSNTFDFDQWKLSDNVLKKFFKNGNLHDCKILEEDMLDFSQKNQSVIDDLVKKFLNKFQSIEVVQ